MVSRWSSCGVWLVALCYPDGLRLLYLWSNHAMFLLYGWSDQQDALSEEQDALGSSSMLMCYAYHPSFPDSTMLTMNHMAIWSGSTRHSLISQPTKILFGCRPQDSSVVGALFFLPEPSKQFAMRY